MSTHADPHGGTSEVTNTLTLRQAAIYLGVHDNTIRRWIKMGTLPALRVGAGGHFRVKPSDLDALVRAA